MTNLKCKSGHDVKYSGLVWNHEHINKPSIWPIAIFQRQKNIYIYECLECINPLTGKKGRPYFEMDCVKGFSSTLSKDKNLEFLKVAEDMHRVPPITSDKVTAIDVAQSKSIDVDDTNVANIDEGWIDFEKQKPAVGQYCQLEEWGDKIFRWNGEGFKNDSNGRYVPKSIWRWKPADHVLDENSPAYKEVGDKVYNQSEISCQSYPRTKPINDFEVPCQNCGMYHGLDDIKKDNNGKYYCIHVKESKQEKHWWCSLLKINLYFKGTRSLNPI